ncbi:MAG: tetratricopeptide repeat protein, partial [Phycisphaerae bacterium]|nr:tetratricopeptide repeat protein [Phycisphaerae bacterium]
KAIERKPDYAKAYLNRGATYANKGLYDQARRDWEQVVKLDPTGPAGQNARHNLKGLRQ